MTVNSEIDVRHWVQWAFNEARSVPDKGSTQGRINQTRSRNFVENLAKYVREQLSPKTSQRVFTKYFASNRKEFGLNELMFDVLWCETATTPSAGNRKSLRFVTHGFWAVESELEEDPEQALYDFNKLVLANTYAKLFVGPSGQEANILVTLKAAAPYVSGKLFLAFVAHPKDWGQPKEQVPKFYRWTGEDWGRLV